MASLFNFLHLVFSRILRALGLASHSQAPALPPPSSVDYYDPTLRGGSFLNKSGTGGEPLNVIISGRSDPNILTPSGFLNYARACGMSNECLGLHQGVPEPANLGDGHGWLGERVIICNQTQSFSTKLSQSQEVLREHYQLPFIGTCIESLVGGNHLRCVPFDAAFFVINAWNSTYCQNGPDANSGALFLAVSQEEDLAEHHNIVPDGYNIGRDKFVKAAVGTRSYCGVTYETTVKDLPGSLVAGAQGVNHGTRFEYMVERGINLATGISQDGVVKLLTVSIVKEIDL
ncbi:hypothetical protein H0H92_007917 [Tricholoma furcatifolium]|nr:hypothetical protein H0H92_007917 [Tricholoma furcatifolium]